MSYLNLNKFALSLSLRVILLIGALSQTVMAAPPAESNKLNIKEADKTTLGWLQSIRLQPYQKRLTAKLDTGAKSSTIHALNIKTVHINGKAYARFTIPSPEEKNGQLEEIMFELPIARHVKIKQHDAKKADKRIVVNLEFCLNHQVYTAEFSLDNREHFNYPVLLGRNFLSGKFLIDPEQTFLYRSYCP